MSSSSELTGVNTLQIAALTETFIYGIYLTIFYQSLQVLHIKRRQNLSKTSYLYLAIIVFFVSSTLNISTTFACNFGTLKSDGSDAMFNTSESDSLYSDIPLEYTGACIQGLMSILMGPNTAYASIASSQINLLKAVLLVTAILLSDSFLAFRCYILWNKQFKVILFPIMILIVDSAFGIMYCAYVGRNGIYNDLDGLLGLFNGLFIPLSLVMNLCCTFLIAYKIWKVQKQVNASQDQLSGSRPSHLNCVIVSILQSGAIYTSWMFITTIAISQNSIAGTRNIISTLAYVFQDTIVQIIGITFSLIISQMGQAISTGSSQVDQTHVRTSIHFRTRLSHTGSMGISMLDSDSNNMQIASPSPKGPLGENERAQDNAIKMGHASSLERPESIHLRPWRPEGLAANTAGNMLALDSVQAFEFHHSVV